MPNQSNSIIAPSCLPNGLFTVSDSLTVTIQNTLTLPIVADAGPDRIVNEQVMITLDGSASFDPENQPLHYTWTQTSGEMVVLASENTVRASFTSPTVANGEVKVLVFELRVYDDYGRESFDTVIITVDPVNAPPTVNASAAQE